MNAAHEDALRWFENRIGDITPWPDPLPGGTLLIQRAKGIHKPGGWDHALSIRVIPAGRYPDEEPIEDASGTWRFRYHQEEPKGSEPESYWTNTSLARCIADGVPVGVMRQVSGKPNVRYEVLGLARVTAWRDGFFELEGPVQLTGASNVPGESDDPISLEDARDRVLSTIVRRRGQPKFRADLLTSYGGRCAISGCAIEAILEAAHIVPYRGRQTNVARNGLLLRADLHTLFDLGLIWVEPSDMTVQVHRSIEASTYSKLRGRKLRLPTDLQKRPDRTTFEQRASLQIGAPS